MEEAEGDSCKTSSKRTSPDGKTRDRHKEGRKKSGCIKHLPGEPAQTGLNRQDSLPIILYVFRGTSQRVFFSTLKKKKIKLN